MIFGKDSQPEVPVPTGLVHLVLGTGFNPPYPTGMSSIRFGMGCFWGVERLFWQLDGVYTTAAAYAGGAAESKNPSYRAVCSGSTGHAEVVQVVFDEHKIKLQDLLKVFWENHDPTQGMRQGNDRGSQYRSIILCDNQEDLETCKASREKYQQALTDNGFGEITTEILIDPVFYLAEADHQQYLAKNPGGYCNHGFCQVEFTQG